MWRSGAFPAKLSFRFLNWHIIDAGKSPHHQTIFGKFPVFIAIGAIPEARIIMPLLLKSHRNTVVHKAPKFFL
jgi:hypothetical protein